MTTVAYRVPDAAEIGATINQHGKIEHPSGWSIFHYEPEDGSGLKFVLTNPTVVGEVDGAPEYATFDEAFIAFALVVGHRHAVYIPTWTELGAVPVAVYGRSPGAVAFAVNADAVPWPTLYARWTGPNEEYADQCATGYVAADTVDWWLASKVSPGVFQWTIPLGGVGATDEDARWALAVYQALQAGL